MADEKLRKHFGDYLGTAEVAILTILAVLISLTALASIARSGDCCGTPGISLWWLPTPTWCFGYSISFWWY
jgi:hypothetical protein